MRKIVTRKACFELEADGFSQHRNKGVFFYTQIRQFNKQYFRKEGLFDMRKIVTRKACFELEADGFSIHTFEISRKLTKSEWHHCKKKLYDQNQVSSKICIYQESKDVHRVSQYEANGLRITLEHAHDQEDSRGYYVRMVVNPRKVIDPDASYIGIFPPEKSSIIELQAAFHTLLKQSVFNDQLDDYYLSRVDLCVNIRCDHKKIFREVVRVLRKLPTPPKYKRVSRKEKDKKKANKYNKHYIKFQCGTHSLVIYDKTYQATEQGLRVDYEDLSGGVLRFEVQYQRSVLRGLEKKLNTDNPSELLWYLMRKSEKVDYEDLSGGVLRFEVQYQRSVLRGLEKKLNTDNPSELLWYLMRKSEKRISKHFEQCFADVQFCQIEEIERRIMGSKYEDETKQMMLELAHRMQRKQSVDQVLEEMDVQFCQIEEIERRIMGSKYEDETKQMMLELAHRMQRKQSVDQVLEEMQSEGFAVNDLLRRVHRLGFSPIPLWKNFCTQQIPGPVSLLRMISEGEVVIPYQKIK